MKNVIIMVISLFACIAADIFGGSGSSIPEFIPAAVPAVTSVTITDINPVTTSTDITAVTSVASASETTTNNIISDDIIDNSVVSEPVTEYTVVYTEYTDTIEYVCSEPAAAPEPVNDDIITDTFETVNDSILDTAADDTMYSNPEEIYYNVNNLYALTAVISDINYSNDIVFCTDFNGFIWSFCGVEDYCINDIVSMIMYDNNTDIIYDDIILNTTYSGYIDTDINNTVSDNIDSLDNADMIPDNTDNTDTSENDLFIEYLNAISSGDYIE